MFLEFGPSQSKIWDCLEPKNRNFFTNLARNRKWNRNRNRGNPNSKSCSGPETVSSSSLNSVQSMGSLDSFMVASSSSLNSVLSASVSFAHFFELFFKWRALTCLHMLDVDESYFILIHGHHLHLTLFLLLGSIKKCLHISECFEVG